MSDQAAARRMRLLEGWVEGDTGRELAAYAQEYEVDERTIRRDVEALHHVLSRLRGVELRRGKVVPTRTGFGEGYFSSQWEQGRAEKEAIARSVVRDIADNTAIAITAGTTTYHVARELRRSFVEEERPREVIAFTNSLPALMELLTAGISTGVLGEVYHSGDCAFHSHEFRSGFQAGVAIVGASGVVVDAEGGMLNLFSHRAEEAAFLKQLLAPIPELVIAVDGAKIGRRHPWRFTGRDVLEGKVVRLVTSAVSLARREELERLTSTARRVGYEFSFLETTAEEPASLSSEALERSGR